MKFRVLGSVLLSCIAALLISTSARSQSTDCSMSRLEESPRSVIEPCSRILQTDISGKERGDALLIRGRGYHRTGRFGLAAVDYDEALTLIPDEAELWLSRANLFFRSRNYRDGSRYLAHAYKLNPKNAHVLRYMGSVANDSGSQSAAYDYYSRALTIDPAEPYALLFRARLLFDRRQLDAAFKDIDALIALDPKVVNRNGYLDGNGRMRDFHIVALAERANMFEALAQFDRAEQDLNSAVAYKRSAESLTARATYLLGRPGRLESALADAREATQLDPDFGIAFSTKGFIFIRLDRFEEAFEALDRAVEIKPDDDYALFMRGRMHRALGRPDAATKDTWAAIALNPSRLRTMMPALRHAGYWTLRDDPKEITATLVQAIQACMIDTSCN